MSTFTLALMGSCLVMVIICSAILLKEFNRDKKVEDRLRMVRRPIEYTQTRGGITADGDTDESSVILNALSRIGASIVASGLVKGKTLAQLSETLVAAGFPSRNALSIFIAAKVLMLGIAPLLAFLYFTWMQYTWSGILMGIGAGAVCGVLLPDYIVRTMRKRHLARVELGLADALDMLVICAEAGLALEPAITRVGREIAPAHPSVSREFLQTASEMRIVADYRVALSGLGNRTGIDGIKRLTVTMVQTLQYGTPLTQALRVLSAELRAEMITRFEARAARLPVLLTLPMIVFILPCVFLVVGGPAIIQVAHIFTKS